MVLQIGDQIGRQEVPEPCFGEEGESAVVAIKKLGSDGTPVCSPLEGTHLVVGLTAFEAPLEESIAWILLSSKGLADLPDDGLLVTHTHLPERLNSRIEQRVHLRLRNGLVWAHHSRIDRGVSLT
jgi:hypothetical protein